jgi:hypothetical protein
VVAGFDETTVAVDFGGAVINDRAVLCAKISWSMGILAYGSLELTP